MSGIPCAFDGCENEAVRGGYCWGHVKQKRSNQPLTALAKRPPTARERLPEAAITYADADGHADFIRAFDNLRKAALAYGKLLQSEAATREIEARRQRGDSVGRPRKADPVIVAELVASLGGPGLAAKKLRVSVRTVQRALKQVGAKAPTADRTPAD